MALNDHTAQEKLTPEARRAILRAFGDRMLIKVPAMDDPEDMPGVERAVRVAAVIERLYSRCDRAEGQAPDPRKLEAERARNAVEAIEQRVVLANTLKWGEDRRNDQGHWWDDAKAMAQNQAQSAPLAPVEMTVAVHAAPEVPQDVSKTAAVCLGDLMAGIDAAAPEGADAVELPEPVSSRSPETTLALFRKLPDVYYNDLADAYRNARAALGLPDIPEDELAAPAERQQKSPPPS